MNGGSSGQQADPAMVWLLTGEQTRIKNQYIICPRCKGREYITALRGTVCLREGVRWFQPVDSHKCPHCAEPYLPIRAEGV